MKKQIAVVLCNGLLMLGLVSTADAALVSRLDGQAVYDTDLDITWLADTNLAKTNTFGVAGISIFGGMSWDVSQDWIAAMNADGGTGYLGVNSWRLPHTPLVNGPCTDFPSPTSRPTSFLAAGWNCTGSEFGHLYYVDFALAAGTSMTNGAGADMFTNIPVSTSTWWTDGQSGSNAWAFFSDGLQAAVSKSPGGGLGVTVVSDGDVLALVPVPAAVWLFGSALIGLLGAARRS